MKNTFRSNPTMRLYVFLVVLVGPTFVHTTNTNFLFVPNGVFSLAIFPVIKESNV
jgi:hypothetical protein